MNYDTIILELLTRIQALEEQVAALSVQMGSSTEPLSRPAAKSGTKELRVYIETLKRARRKLSCTEGRGDSQGKRTEEFCAYRLQCYASVHGKGG